MRNENLHGNAPDECAAALLIIDVINDLEFEGSEKLLEYALPVAEKIRHLKKRARKLGIPVIYVNDNFGKWRSDFLKQIAHCLEDGVRGEPIARLLAPDDADYFVLKPKHSGFYSTVLDTLLAYLKTENLILTGLTGDGCVFFTANDAYLRDYHLFIPADCVASIDAGDNEYALRQMRKTLKADLGPSSELNLEELIR